MSRIEFGFGRINRLCSNSISQAADTSMMTPVLDTFCTIYFGDDDVVEDDDDDVVEDVDDEEEHDRGSCILQRLLWLVFTHQGILGLVDKDPPHLQSHTHTPTKTFTCEGLCSQVVACDHGLCICCSG